MNRVRRDDFVGSLNCNLLRTFIRVLELGSITGAAQSLYLAQSAVSGQIATLASYAGGTLLERRGGRLAPTRLGTALYEGSLDLLVRASELEKRLRTIVDKAARSVAVSCTRTVCETSVARVVSLFAQACRDVRLQVSSGTLKEVEVRLRAGETDVALVEGFTDLPGARLVAFQVDRLLLAVPPGHPLAGSGSVRFEEAAKYPFVMRTRASSTRLLIEQRLGRCFENLGIAIELEGNSEVVSCVEAGLGLALLSETALTSALAARTVVASQIEDVDFTREFYLAVPQERPLSDAAQLFVDWLSTHYAEAKRRELLTA